jgi:MATE family multidrug resistance protein
MVKEEATPLLTKSEENDELEASEGVFWAEFKRVGSMAAPMVTVTVSQYLLQVVSLMMVGHIGILASFSGVALAVSFAECSGFCVLVMSSSFQFFLSDLFFLCAFPFLCDVSVLLSIKNY